MTDNKITQRDKVEKKYGAMVSYYGELLGLCHQAISVNTVLNKLDPMGQKTSATTLFIRVCARMDKTDATDMADKLMSVSKEKTNQKVA